jgi:exo-beta-1,3-glucanase (GH17 family)
MNNSAKVTQAAQYIERTRSQNGEAINMDQIVSILNSYFSFSGNPSMWDIVDYYDQHHEEYFVTEIIETCPSTTFNNVVPEAANDEFYDHR